MDLIYTPTDFVAVFNQTLEYAYPNVALEGELANVRVSRGKWVYFDLKDEVASLRCFGTVYQMPGPIEDGMTVRLLAAPRLHQLYGFNLNVISLRPVGEGSIKKAANLLEKKLAAEGLFDNDRKRSIPYAPEHIALITSVESAAYKDFIKILQDRWVGVRVQVLDVQVQGEQAIDDVARAFDKVSQLDPVPEVVVLTRGGGSADDLSVFSTEQVVRAVAGSRVPTVVAIGHEQDLSLAEMAADLRASTPSNAAELLVPDKRSVRGELKVYRSSIYQQMLSLVRSDELGLGHTSRQLKTHALQSYESGLQNLHQSRHILELINPSAVLRRGYAIVRSRRGSVISSKASAEKQRLLRIEFHDGTLDLRETSG